VSNKCLRLAAALLGVVCLGIPASAQSTENRISISGELRGDTGTPLSDCRVELSSVEQRGEIAGSEVQPDGTFAIRNIPRVLLPGDKNF